jgi:hypothetical protein
MHARNLFPIEDAYISQFYANRNFGGEQFLYTNRYQGPNDEYQSLLKFIIPRRHFPKFDKHHHHFDPCCDGHFHHDDCFDFDHHDDCFDFGHFHDDCCDFDPFHHDKFFDFKHHHFFHLAPARLRLKIYRNELPRPITLFAFKVIGDWSENTVTWNNRPAISANPIGSVVVAPGNFNWIDIDLHDPDFNGFEFSVLLKCEEPFDSLLGFYSSEFPNRGFWPELLLGVRRDDEDEPIVRVSGPFVTLPSNLVRRVRRREDRKHDRKHHLDHHRRRRRFHRFPRVRRRRKRW